MTVRRFDGLAQWRGRGPTAVTVGVFDGVHRGHQAILARCRALADAEGLTAVAVTFDPDPATVLSPDRPVHALTPTAPKCDLLGRYGVDAVVVLAATREFLATPSETFVRTVLGQALAARYLVEGPDFFLGREHTDLPALARLGRGIGMNVVEVPGVRVRLAGREETRLSSSLLRDLLLSGHVADAAAGLGRPFALAGTVVAGERRGRQLEFPTANIAPGDQLVPGDGVYAAWAALDGRRYPSAVSIGTKPTFGASPRCVEANLLGAAGDFYGQDISLHFLERLREQRAFADAAALRAAIAADVQRVRELCAP